MIFFLLLFSQFCFADGESSHPLGSLSYLPPAGQSVWSFSYESQTRLEETYAEDGSGTLQTTKIGAPSFVVDYQRALNGTWVVGAALKNGQSLSVTDYGPASISGGESEEVRDMGLYDPELWVLNRFSSDESATWDILGLLSPGILEGKSGAVDADGNLARGGHFVRLDVSRTWKSDLEWKLTARLNLEFQGKRKAVDTAIETTGSERTIGLLADVRGDIQEGFLWTGSLETLYVQETIFETSGVQQRLGGHFENSLGFDLALVDRENFWLLKFGYRYGLPSTATFHAGNSNLPWKLQSDQRTEITFSKVF